MNKDRTHLKPKRQMKLMQMRALTIIITMITIMPQVRVEAADLLLVKVVTDNLEVSHNEIEAKDLSIVNVSFRIIDIREVHPNKTVLNTAITANPIFKEINQITTEAKAMAVVLKHFRGHGHGRANYQNSNGAYQYQYYIHDPLARTIWPTLQFMQWF